MGYLVTSKTQRPGSVGLVGLKKRRERVKNDMRDVRGSIENPLYQKLKGDYYSNNQAL